MSTLHHQCVAPSGMPVSRVVLRNGLCWLIVLFVCLTAVRTASADEKKKSTNAVTTKSGGTKPGLTKKDDPSPEPKASSAELLQFVCAKDEAWSMDQLSLSESISSVKPKIERSANVPGAQQEKLSALMQSNDRWPTKLLTGIELTPLYLRIACRSDDQVAIADVIAKFGEPERKQKDIIYRKNSSTSSGEWYYYGQVRLGVYGEGRILSVQLDSPDWTALNADMDAAQAKVAEKKAALKQPAKPIDPEAKAASEVRLAKQLLKSNPTAAKRRLEDVTKEFPETQAAVEAKKLLDGE